MSFTSYSSIVNNPECRSFIAEGFLAALSPDESSAFNRGFEGVCADAWPEYKSPFYNSDIMVGHREYQIFRLAVALGYSVGQLEASLGIVADASVSDDRFKEYREIARRAENWLMNGPTTILSCARSALSPVDPKNATIQSFCLGYLGGVSYLDGLLAIGVH